VSTSFIWPPAVAAQHRVALANNIN